MARKARFNLLLLDEGEFLLEEFTAFACFWSSAPKPQGDDDGAEWKSRGRLRVCTRGLFFEPEDARLPVVKFSFRTMPGAPSPMSAWTTAVPLASGAATKLLAAESLSVRDAFVCQVTSLIEMKGGGVVGPYRTRTLAAAESDGSPAAATPGTPAAAKPRSLFGLGTSKGVAAAAAASGKAAGSPLPPSVASAHRADRPSVLFALQHAAASSMLGLVQQLWEIQQAAVSAHSSFERASLTSVLSTRREGPFNLSLLSDYREKPLLPASPAAVPVERVFPLVTCPARIMVTEKAVYLQPVSLNNVAGGDPVTRWWLRDVRRVLRRTRLLQHVGLELVMRDRSLATSVFDAAAAGLRGDSAAAATVFLVFQTRSDRDAVYRVILAKLQERAAESGEAPPPVERKRAPGPSSKGKPAEAGPVLRMWREAAATPEDYDDASGDATLAGLAEATRAWQTKAMSNYDYLMLLNSVAGRSVSDLTQYPVLPWVIADYTSRTLDLASAATYRDLSKPMGALNATRLARTKERYLDMPRGADMDPPFMWGTHYSTPGYCLFYLVRAMPEHMLRLQAGKFDAADRLFFDLSSTWNGVTSENMDVKELPPEFYNSDGSFLLIPDALDLGVRQNGKRVGDVGLPAWAYDSGDFVARCREALESDHVSNMLHHWIDLIFGAKQRGSAAEAADNIFYFMTYEGAVDIDSITDSEKRLATQQQLAEFGQTPRQVFDRPHVARTGPVLLLTPSTTADATAANDTPVADSSPERSTAVDLDTSTASEFSLASQSASTAALDASKSAASSASTFASRTWLPVTESHITTLPDATTSIVAAPAASGDVLVASSTRAGHVRLQRVTVTRAADSAAARVVDVFTATPSRPASWADISDLALMTHAAVSMHDTLPISGLCFAAHARYILAASWDHCMHAFSCADGSRIAAWPAHDGVVTACHVIDMMEDASAVQHSVCATAGMDGAVRVWGLALEGRDRLTCTATPQRLSARDATCPSTCVRLLRIMPDLLMLVVGDATGGIMVHVLRTRMTRSHATAARESVAAGTLDAARDACKPRLDGDVTAVQPVASAECASLVDVCTAARGDILLFSASGIVGIDWGDVAVGDGDASVTLCAATAAGHVAVLAALFTAEEGAVTVSLVRIVTTGEVLRCIACLDGSAVVTGGNNGVVRVWDIQRATGSNGAAAGATPVEDAESSLLTSMLPGQVALAGNGDSGRGEKKRAAVSWQVTNAEEIGKPGAPPDRCVDTLAMLSQSVDAQPYVLVLAVDRAARCAAWISSTPAV